jgi:hypothetical protein
MTHQTLQRDCGRLSRTSAKARAFNHSRKVFAATGLEGTKLGRKNRTSTLKDISTTSYKQINPILLF